MNPEKFSSSLIAWVNCLELSPPIKDMNELRNGIFYSNLMQQINKKCKDEIADNTCIAIINFLQLKYALNNRYSNVKNFDEIAYNDLIMITALLLHYTTIVELKSSFKDSMCQKLSPTEQIFIKEFLEKFDNIKNYEDIVDFNPYANSIPKAKSSNGSPLQEFFQTPIRRFKHPVRDKQLQQLKIELEIVSSEKIELQDELKSTKNKLKAISTELREKTEDLKKTRCDLFAIQNRTPPRDNEPNINELRRKYMSEIDSLEMYISQLQKEQQKLQDENKVFQEKFQHLEVENIEWKDKYLSIQTNFDALKEKYDAQKAELLTLSTSYKELKLLLEELRNSESTDDTSKIADDDCSCDRLGCALNLSELEETRKERDEIKSILKESLAKELKLNSEIESYKSNLNTINFDYKKLQQDNDQLCEKLEEMHSLEKVVSDLKAEMVKASDELNQFKETNTGLGNEITTLKESLSNTETKLRTKQDVCKRLEKDLKACKENCESLEKKYTAKNKQFIDLSNESSLLQNKYAKTVDNFNKTSFELNAIKNRFDELNKNIDTSLRKLEFSICGKAGSGEIANNESFVNNLIEQLDVNKESFNTERESLNNKISDLEQIGNELKKTVEILTTQNEIHIQEKQSIKCNIEKLEHHLIELNEQISNYTKKIEHLEATTKDLEENIKTLEKLKEVIASKDELIGSLRKDNENFAHLLKTKDGEISERKTKEEAQKQQLANLQSEINKLQQEILVKRDNIVALEENLLIATNELEIKTADLNRMEKLRAELNEDYENTAAKLNQKIAILTETINKVQKELECKLQENKVIDELLKDQIAKYKDLEADRAKILQEQDEIHKRLNKELEKLVSKELEISEKNKTLVLYEGEITILKTDIEKKDSDIKEFEQLVDDQECTIDVLRANIDQLNFDKQTTQAAILELEKEIVVLNEMKQNLESKNVSLENNMQKTFSELQHKVEELKFCSETARVEKENAAEKLDDCQKKLDIYVNQLNELSDAQKTTTSEYEKKINKLKNKIKSLEAMIVELNEKETRFVQELQSTKTELNETINKYTVALQTQQEIRHEYETQIHALTENLHNLLEKYNHLKLETDREISCAKNNAGKLETANNKLEVQLSEEKSMYENQFKEMENQLNLEIDDLRQKQTALETESENLQKELQSSNKVNADVEKEIKEISTKLGEVTAEKMELQRKHNALNDNYNKLLNDVESLNDNRKMESVKLKELEAEIEKLSYEKKTSENQQNELIAQIDDLSNEISSFKSNHDSLIKDKDDEIKYCASQLKEYETRIVCLNEEIDNLSNSYEKTKLNYENLKEVSEADDAKLLEVESRYIQLKAAYDLLETGHENLNKEHKSLYDEYQKIQSDKEEIQTNYDKNVGERIIEISKLSEQATYYKECSALKDQALSKLQSDLDELNEKLQNKDTFMGQMSQEKESLEQKLQQLKEEFDKTLNGKDVKIEELKNFHNTTTTELINLKTDNSNLKQQIDAFLREREELQQLFVEKESIILELKQQNQQVDATRKQIEQQLLVTSEKFSLKLEELKEVKAEKYQLLCEQNKLSNEVDKLKKSRDELLEYQAKVIKETENNILRHHNNAIEVKNDLLKRIELTGSEILKEKELRAKLEEALSQEKESKNTLNARVLELECEKNKMTDIHKMITQNLRKLSCLLHEKPLAVEGELVDNCDVDKVDEIINDMESRVADIFKKKRELSELIQQLERNQNEINATMAQLHEEKTNLNDEKQRLLNNYESLLREKAALETDRDQDHKSLKLLEVELDSLKEKCELLAVQSNTQNELLEEKNQLASRLNELAENKNHTYHKYQELVQRSKAYKDRLKKIWKMRGELEENVNKIKTKWIDIETKGHHVTTASQAQLVEKRLSLSFIHDDIMKQFSKIFACTYNANLNITTITEQCIENILSNTAIDIENVFKSVNLGEIEEKVEDLKDNTEHFLEQLQQFKAYMENNAVKKAKSQKEREKENIVPVSISEAQQANVTVPIKDEEWRKKNLALKQRLTLSDNAKSVFERKLKQLREENKRLAEETVTVDKDGVYNNLLQEYNAHKKDCEKRKSECDTKYEELLKDFEEYKKSHKVKTEKLQQQHPQQQQSQLHNKPVVKKGDEMQKLRDAYSNVMNENSKLNVENSNMAKKLEENSRQIKNLSQVKVAYEKLLEEHNQFRMNLDLVKFNTSKEIEMLKKKLETDKEALSKSYHKQRKELNAEWEHKLEKIKDKMTKVFREEMEKEIAKRTAVEDKNEYLITTVEELKEELRDAQIKINKAEAERNKTIEQLQHVKSLSSIRRHDLHGSRESISSIRSSASQSKHSRIKPEPLFDEPSSSSHRYFSSYELPCKEVNERKYSTIPSSSSSSTRMEKIDEARVSSSVSHKNLNCDAVIQSIKMENEGELFDNKYLDDLQTGKCVVPKVGRESTSSRMSELAWRNSLCPPHLKSSYPAETQFSDPRRFKDDDLKTGHIDLNDSMSLRLLPNEKSRKKDFGTTSYKKPGPPTPSKNGGRPSLQGNEFHLNTESKTPKKSTPSRLRALFKKRNSNAGETSESSSTTPKAKRLSFFRKY